MKVKNPQFMLVAILSIIAPLLSACDPLENAKSKLARGDWSAAADELLRHDEDPNARVLLADLYRDGKGVVKSDYLALRLYERAAEKNLYAKQQAQILRNKIMEAENLQNAQAKKKIEANEVAVATALKDEVAVSAEDEFQVRIYCGGYLTRNEYYVFDPDGRFGHLDLWGSLHFCLGIQDLNLVINDESSRFELKGLDTMTGFGKSYDRDLHGDFDIEANNSGLSDRDQYLALGIEVINKRRGTIAARAIVKKYGQIRVTGRNGVVSIFATRQYPSWPTE